MAVVVMAVVAEAMAEVTAVMVVAEAAVMMVTEMAVVVMTAPVAAVLHLGEGGGRTGHLRRHDGGSRLRAPGSAEHHGTDQREGDGEGPDQTGSGWDSHGGDHSCRHKDRVMRIARVGERTRTMDQGNEPSRQNVSHGRAFSSPVRFRTRTGSPFR